MPVSAQLVHQLQALACFNLKLKAFAFMLCNSWWKKPLVTSQQLSQGALANLICGAYCCDAYQVADAG